MLESTRVFEGRDLSTLGGSGAFCSVNGNEGGIYGGYGISIPPIKDEGSAGYSSSEGMGDDEEGDEEEGDGGRVRRTGAWGETRLPGFAELNGEIEAFAERGGATRVKVEREDEASG